MVAHYVHNAVSDGLGKMGVIVALESTGDADELARSAGMIAMHVAASNPQAIDSVRPRSRGRSRARRTSWRTRPRRRENRRMSIEKIVESGLKTFYKEVCLLDQPFVHDDKKSVAQALKEAEGKVGAPIKITGFVRFALGEGIERQDIDFAAEVAATAGRADAASAFDRDRRTRADAPWPSRSTAA